jgi:glycosyltransferase involved in cell wall biosynthesis
MFGLPKLAQEIEPDIIHMSFPFPFIRQWFKAPVLSTVHDFYPYESPENFGYPQVWFNQLFLRQCIYNSDGLICVSGCTLEALQNYFPKAKASQRVEVIYNVVDIATIKAKKPQLPIDYTSCSFLLTVAQHRKNKNLDLLIHAYHQLLIDGQLQETMRLLIVGSQGPETEHLTHLIKSLELEEKVHFLSGLTDGELCWLYRNTALFVIASATEGFCLPLVEALSLAGSAVCSDIPIFREVGASQCRYFALDEHASENLGHAIVEELALERNKEVAVDYRFSKENIAQQLLNYYSFFENLY